MPWVIVGIGFAVLVVLRHVAARRAARGDRRFLWLVFGPTFVYAAIFLLAAAKVFQTEPVAGLLMLAIAVVTATLLVRMVFKEASGSGPAVPEGELSGPAFDFLVWGALGVPLLLAAVLVVMLVTGGLGATR